MMIHLGWNTICHDPDTDDFAVSKELGGRITNPRFGMVQAETYLLRPGDYVDFVRRNVNASRARPEPLLDDIFYATCSRCESARELTLRGFKGRAAASD